MCLVFRRVVPRGVSGYLNEYVAEPWSVSSVIRTILQGLLTKVMSPAFSTCGRNGPSPRKNPPPTSQSFRSLRVTALMAMGLSPLFVTVTVPFRSRYTVNVGDDDPARRNKHSVPNAVPRTILNHFHRLLAGNASEGRGGGLIGLRSIMLDLPCADTLHSDQWNAAADLVKIDGI